MDQGLIERLAREVLAKYRLGADFKVALGEATRRYLATYPKSHPFGTVMSHIARVTRAKKPKAPTPAPKPVQGRLF